MDGDGWTLNADLSANRSTPLAFSRNDRAVYISCPAKTGGFGICRLDVAKHTYDTAWSNPNVEADGLANGSAEDSVIGVSFMDSLSGLSVFDADSTDAQAMILLMKQFPGEQVGFTSGTRDGRLTIVKVEADADPGAFYLFDRKAKKLSLLLSRKQWIDPAKMARKQPFEFAARDGLKLHGYVTCPPGQEDAKNLPTVVMVHGGSFGSRDRWDFESDLQTLATRGYAAVQVNFRGSGGYGYDFERAGWREWGGRMQDDFTDATRWVIAQHIANPQHICIYAAATAAMRHWKERSRSLTCTNARSAMSASTTCR